MDARSDVQAKQKSSQNISSAQKVMERQDAKVIATRMTEALTKDMENAKDVRERLAIARVLTNLLTAYCKVIRADELAAIQKELEDMKREQNVG